MSYFKKVVAALALVLIFSISGVGQAQAAEIAVTVGDGWRDNSWTGAVGATLGDQYTLANGSGVYIELTDGFVTGDAFRVSNNGSTIGVTTTPLTSGVNGDGVTGDLAWANLNYSWGVFALAAGPALVSINTSLDCCGAGSMFVRFVLSPSRLMPGKANALRLDTQGITTEKSNVVSCTPGKYTFLNGGATPETAKIQSYVYTLLVNGTAVSTLSSDGFKSVAAHMFPTVPNNMTGTATLDGATWDLKGTSNYSAQCQVYATQSGGNTQSVTTAAHDAVALATAAELAANAQATKDMISNWAATYEELAKKLRDQRLAGKP